MQLYIFTSTYTLHDVARVEPSSHTGLFILWFEKSQESLCDFYPPFQ